MIWPARGRDAISLLDSVDALSYSTALRKSRILRGVRSRCGVSGPPLVRHPGAAADPARAPDLLPAHTDSPRDRPVRGPTAAGSRTGLICGLPARRRRLPVPARGCRRRAVRTADLG